MTEAMPFLRKIILLSYDPRPFLRAVFAVTARCGALTIKRRRGTLKQVRRGAQNKTVQGFGCPAAPRICSGGILSPARGERMRGLERITAQKGTKDVLPAESYRWQHLEGALRDTVALLWI